MSDNTISSGRVAGPEYQAMLMSLSKDMLPPDG